MKPQILLHIPEPCHENWDAMTTADKGKHCNSCNKIVVDFSVMSDRQVLDYFKNATGNTCGRFHDDQLQRPLVEPQKQPSKWSYFLASFIAFIMSAKTFSQQKVGKVKFVGKPSVERVELKGDVIEVKKDTIVSQKIQGKVLDEKGKGIANATVNILRTTKAVATDSLGNFSIVKQGEKNAIRVSANGYETKVVDVKGEIIVILIAASNVADEVIIQVPYGNVKKTMFVGSTQTISAKDLEKMQATSVSNILEGILGGVSISNKINGKVVDEKGAAIAGATILIKGTKIGLYTKADGSFEISKTKNKKIVLIFSGVGLKPKEVVVPSTQQQSLIVKLSDDNEMWLGEYVICKKKNKKSIKDTIIKKVQQIFNKESIKIYPNPATKNSIIHITIKDAGEYALHFFDAQSRLLTVKNIVTNSTNQTTEFPLPAIVSSGNYFIRILNEKTKKQVTEKIIVQ